MGTSQFQTVASQLDQLREASGKLGQAAQSLGDATKRLSARVEALPALSDIYREEFRRPAFISGPICLLRGLLSPSHTTSSLEFRPEAKRSVLDEADRCEEIMMSQRFQHPFACLRKRDLAPLYIFSPLIGASTFGSQEAIRQLISNKLTRTYAN